MKQVSILNNVIGPVMRGPSSSHTAGPWRIGLIARDLLGEPPAGANLFFHPESSLAVCYHDQGSDLAFVTGLLGRDLTDSKFPLMLEEAHREGIEVTFGLKAFPEADHPNSALLEVIGPSGKSVRIHARSVGGGSIEIASVNGFSVFMTGDRYVMIVETEPDKAQNTLSLLRKWDKNPGTTKKDGRTACLGTSFFEPTKEFIEEIKNTPSVLSLHFARPVMLPPCGKETFLDISEMIDAAETEGLTLGEAAMAGEVSLLGLPVEELQREMAFRLSVMLESVERGLVDRNLKTKLVAPVAGDIYEAESKGEMFLGGVHARAATRSMAVMHVNGAGGVVCSAPTGGSAGVIPAVAATLLEDFDLSREKVLSCLWAAGAIGWALDKRSTFAAEVAGCQVEIGAAGAMGAAAVVEAAGGTARQACDAAAMVFQNVMGSVCDLVQGIVEIPCHSRNAALASQAFLAADLVLGGYRNLIPLDETIDAIDSVGRMLPAELRCTSRGGLALCPSAREIPRRDLT